MAAKVNTRFVLGLVIALGAALALLGAVYVLKMRGDATRSQRRGVAAMASGDYKAAYDQFGRALHKDPGNPEYLQNMQEALTKIVPQTAGEAREFYTGYLGTISHAAIHNPKDAEAHLRLLRELHSGARQVNDAPSWGSVLASADSMHQQVADGDPLRPLASVYRAIAVTRLATSKPDDDVQQAIKELDQAIAALGDNDLAWSTAISGRLAWLQKIQAAGKSRSMIDAARSELDETAKRAIEHVPNGHETALSYLAYVMLRRMESPESISNEDIRAAADHLYAIVTPQDDPGLINATALYLSMVPEVGRAKAASLLQRAVEARPNGHDHRLLLAKTQFDQGDLDQAEASARIVQNADRLPVSFLSQMLFQLRPQAVALIGDIEARRLDQTPPSERETQLGKMIAARDALAALSTDTANDPMVARADGKIAFARKSFVEAAQKFERLVRETNSRDTEMLMFAALSLQQVGQFGLAHERVTRALVLQPGVPQWLVLKAELEMRIGQVDQAAITIQAIPDAALSDPRTQQIVSAVRLASASGGAVPSSDPVQAAINAASEFLNKNEPENARAALLAALEANPDALPLLQALAQTEIRAGNREAAQQYVDRGLKNSPSDPILNQISAGLRFEDPVLATLEYFRATVADEKARNAAMLVSLANLSIRQRMAAAELEHQGRPDDAAKARETIERAGAECDRLAAAMQTSDPDNRDLNEYQFVKALEARDWAKAETVVATAKRLDLDSAGGVLIEGRLEISRGNYRQAITLLETATERLSFSSYAWRTLALAYQSASNFAQAERAFEQAYRCNPNDIAGARAYLALLSRRGDKSRALQILQSVHILAPQDRVLREAWLDLEAEVGDAALALRQRLLRYSTDPKDRDNSAALALLLGTVEPAPASMISTDGQPMYSPQRWATITPAEQDEIKRGFREQWATLADGIVNALATAYSDDLRVTVLRANIQKQRGDAIGGETTLRDFINRHEKAKQTEDMYVELGRYQAATQHFNDAVESLRLGVALAGPQQREAEVQLGTLLMQLQQYPEAVTVLQSAQARRAEQTTQFQIIECLINVGKLDEAEKSLTEATSGNSGSVSTLLAASIARARASAMVAQGDFAGADRALGEQRDLLARAEQQDPTNPLPRILLAQSLIDEYNRTKRTSLLDDAMVALDRAERIRAGVSQVNAMRVAIQKERGDMAGAINDARRLVDAEPANVNARRDLIQLLLEARNQDDALRVVEDGIKQTPTSPIWHELRGDMLRDTQGVTAAVIESYVSAYQHGPVTAMLRKLCSAMLAVSPPDCQGVVTRIDARKDDLPTDPVLRENYAIALACMGSRDLAIEQLRLAYEQHRADAQKDPKRATEINSWYLALSDVFAGGRAAEGEKLQQELTAGRSTLDDLIGLTRFWGRMGNDGLSRAIEVARQAAAQCPADDPQRRGAIHEDLGRLSLMSGDMRSAADALAVVVELRPDDWNSTNNLAFLYANELNEPQKALPLAERLVQSGVRDAGVLDTVGWVYFKNGDSGKAMQYLSESVAILPTLDAYLHLAEVMLRGGDAAGAEKQLQSAEKLNPNPQSLQKISALRDDIGRSGGAAGSPPGAGAGAGSGAGGG